MANCQLCGNEIGRMWRSDQRFCGVPCRNRANCIAKSDLSLVFWDKIEKSDGCWLWRGYVNPNSGYGTFTYEKKSRYAHRFSYERHHGEIPPSYEVDHSCRNPICVNPEHLEAVPPIVNKHRANPPKTHCMNGHLLDHKNSYITPANKRRCRTCHRERARLYAARKRATG